MYFSLLGERKVPKERHLRKVPTVPSLGIYPPDQRAILPVGKMANALSSRSLPWSRTVVRVTTARLAAVWLYPRFSFNLQEKQRLWAEATR